MIFVISLLVILTTNRSTLCSSVYPLNGLTLNDFRQSIQQQMGAEPNRKSCYLVRNDRSARAGRSHHAPFHLVAEPAKKENPVSISEYDGQSFVSKLRLVEMRGNGNYKKSAKDGSLLISVSSATTNSMIINLLCCYK